ncbi:MAG: site-2 protease family protein [Polyangiaceae bacterium]
MTLTGIELADLYAANVPEDSYLYKVACAGDKILKLDDEPLPAWSTFRERLVAAPDRQHHIDYLSARDGRARRAAPSMRAARTSSWTSTARRSLAMLHVKNWVPLAPEDFVAHPSPNASGTSKALEETSDVTRFTLVSIVRVIQGRMSLKSLVGPITIYEVAGE